MREALQNFGLRTRLFAFFGLVLAPIVVFLGVSLNSEYQTTIAAAKNDVRQMAETIAARQSGVFREAKAFLDTVRQLPDISTTGGPACHALLAGLAQTHPQYHTIGVIDASRMITCHSALQTARPIGNPDVFARMNRQEAPDFNVSQFLVGKFSQQPTVIASMRLPPVDGVSPGFVFVSMNLGQLLKFDDVPIGDRRSVMLIEMPSARLLARYPALDLSFGLPIPWHPVVKAATVAGEANSGQAEGFGLDGVDRLFGYAPLEAVGDGRIIVGVGLPRAGVLAALQHRGVIAAIGCGTVLVLSSIAVWWIGYWTQIWPIARLRDVSQRIASGDLEARATIENWQAPEFRALGSTFDAMAGKLEEGRKAEKAVADSNRYFEITERLAQVGYWQLDLATMQSKWSDEVFRIYGLSPDTEPPSVDTIIATFHPDDRVTIEEALEKAICDGAEFEVQLRLHRSGELRYILSRGRVEKDSGGNVVLVYGAIQDITGVKQAELNANSANAMLMMAEEMAEVGHWRFDVHERTLIWSEQVYRIHGLDPATHRPSVEAAIQFYHPDDREDVAKAVAAAVVDIRDYEFSKRIVRSDGSIRDVVSRGRCEIDPTNGEVNAIFGVIMDVTALRQAERDLSQKSDLLKTTLETIDQGLIMVGNDGRLDVSNRRFAELLDLPASMLDANRPDFEDILEYLQETGEYAASSDAFQRRVSARGQPFTLGVYERHRPNGRILEVRTVALPDGKGIVRTYTDVTHRRNAERALQESEARYRMLVENASDMIFRLDRDFVRTYVSPASMDMLGYWPEELTGRKPVDMVHPDDMERVTAAYCSVLGGIDRTNTTNRIRHRDGRWVWVEVELRALRQPNSRDVVGIAGIMRDISERQAQSEQLEAARKAAEEALRAKSDFLAVMSHELRTPLNGIIGFANLLGSRPELTQGPASPYVKNIQTASRHLLSIVNDVLDVSKGEAGALALDVQPFVFRHFVKDTVGVVAEEAKSKGLAFHVDIDPSIPERLIGDDARLRQVLVNLLANSLKFTAKGRVALKASLVDREETWTSVSFCVSDTGIGIPDDKLDTLFQRFMQADQSISRRFGGTGLGLSICKDILRLMDSKISVTSCLGEGSNFEFTIKFPIAPAQEDELEIENAVLTSRGAMSILVAEDVLMNQDLLKILLEQWGHTVEIVSDGVMAVAAVVAKRFDLILMDIHMPGMDGVEATRLIRAMKGTAAAATPIVALTANVFPEQVAAFRDAGMNGHVAKPFVTSELHRAIETLRRYDTARDDRSFEIHELRPVFHRETLDDLTSVMGPEAVRGFLKKLEMQIRDAASPAVLDLAQVPMLRSEAHALLSSAGFLGFQRLSDACSQFENSPFDPEEMAIAFQRLSQARRETLAVIQSEAA